ncbi:MAG: iron ABC transporter permease [Candidatus Omnitrophota bacterium]
MKYVRWASWLGFLAVLLAAVIVWSLSVGASGIPAGKVLGILFQGGSPAEHSIIFDIRLPRILLGLAIGGCLSLAGVILQGLFRNPLVEPYTLGISGGAALGVAANIALGISAIGAYTLPVSGLLGAGAVIVFLYFSSLRTGLVKLQGLLLNGVMISFISSSLVMLLMSIASSESLHGIVFWMMGSLGGSDVTYVNFMLMLSLAALATGYAFCLALNALALGEDEARHLGVPIERVKKVLFVFCAVLTGLCVSIAGMIGFVGLVVPHVMRRLVGADHRILLGASFIAGAIFLIASDTLARIVITPLELPVGVITGIAGGSVFLYALAKKGGLDHA